MQCDISCITIFLTPWFVFCCLQVGSADHHIHYFDLRNPSNPLFVFRGHRKAVSYVKFLSSNELASASTDSTLRLWDVQTNCSVCIYCSHILYFVVIIMGISFELSNIKWLLLSFKSGEAGRRFRHYELTPPCHGLWNVTDLHERY
jgi:WD40 repeat protein